MSTIQTLAAIDLTRIYGRGYALKKANFELQSGTITALVGANGAGKSTAFNLLAGRIKASAGKIQLDGVETCFDPEDRNRIGFLSHESYLYGGLTASENLCLYAGLHGVDDTEVASVLEQVGLTKQANRQAQQFSRGMIQRLALGRLLLTDPSVWLLDEPASGLDEAGRNWLSKTIRGLADKGRIIAFSTHHRQLAAELATHTIVLKKGRVVQSGEVEGAETVQALFEEHVA